MVDIACSSKFTSQFLTCERYDIYMKNAQSFPIRNVGRPTSEASAWQPYKLGCIRDDAFRRIFYTVAYLPLRCTCKHHHYQNPFHRPSPLSALREPLAASTSLRNSARKDRNVPDTSSKSMPSFQRVTMSASTSFLARVRRMSL